VQPGKGAVDGGWMIMILLSFLSPHFRSSINFLVMPSDVKQIYLNAGQSKLIFFWAVKQNAQREMGMVRNKEMWKKHTFFLRKNEIIYK